MFKSTNSKWLPFWASKYQYTWLMSSNRIKLFLIDHKEQKCLQNLNKVSDTYIADMVNYSFYDLKGNNLIPFSPKSEPFDILNHFFQRLVDPWPILTYILQRKRLTNFVLYIFVPYDLGTIRHFRLTISFWQMIMPLFVLNLIIFCAPFCEHI